MKDRSDDPSHHERTLLPTELHLAPIIAQWVHSMKDRSDDPSHHERRLLPTELHLAPIKLNGSAMKDRSDDPSHHERSLLPMELHLAPIIAQWVCHEGSIRRPIAPWCCIWLPAGCVSYRSRAAVRDRTQLSRC